MARSGTGRIVVEIDPVQKRELYSALAMEGKTFKKWLVEQVTAYLAQEPAGQGGGRE